ncbi:unnamed protein product [Absidia cylindrospora]
MTWPYRICIFLSSNNSSNKLLQLQPQLPHQLPVNSLKFITLMINWAIPGKIIMMPTFNWITPGKIRNLNAFVSYLFLFVFFCRPIPALPRLVNKADIGKFEHEAQIYMHQVDAFPRTYKKLLLTSIEQ